MPASIDSCFFPVQASQTTNLLSEHLLSQNAWVYPTQGPGPNYKRREKWNWLLIELPG